jgi:hypothetical protein
VPVSRASANASVRKHSVRGRHCRKVGVTKVLTWRRRLFGHSLQELQAPKRTFLNLTGANRLDSTVGTATDIETLSFAANLSANLCPFDQRTAHTTLGHGATVSVAGARIA